MSSKHTFDNLEVKDMTTEKEIKGTKHSLIFSKNGSITGIGSFDSGEVSSDSGHGIVMTRPGSITGLSMSYDSTARYKGASVKIYVFPNLAWSLSVATSVADNKSITRKQARGTDTFSAGDYIFVNYSLSTGILDNVIITVEVVYDE